MWTRSWMLLHRAEEKRIGQIEWKVNPENRAKVRAALLNHEKDAWDVNFFVLQGDVWVLNARQLLYLRSRNIISSLPNLSEDEISDRGKSDFLVKGLAVTQILWLIMRMISQAAKSLHTSHLEVLTLAYCVCALIIYAFLWNKPQNVKTMHYLHVSADASRSLRVDGYIGFGNEAPAQWWPIRHRHYPIPNGCIHVLGGFAHDMMGGCAIGSFIFGSVHLIAWNFEFPTSVEQQLWRISSIVTAISPACIWLTNYLLEIEENPKVRGISRIAIEWTSALCGWIFVVIVSPVYTLSRLFISVEVFRALCFIPSDAFIDTWANYLPQIH
ncbi:hypothetical protein F4775DRAFT_550467 [Biscogniauxia sp. FL1348]|nr:hypothetical protein F4775DRAFT_550467 [Biscogniauxia sp. FL1348]